MDKFNINHTAAALIIFFSVSLFFQLDKAEIQPWDEGLYAMRAMSIVKYGEAIDQTQHSIGGLYSSTYPPLTVWVMAGMLKIFEPHIAVRLLSVICGAAAFLFIFLISRRFLSGEMSLITIIGLAVTVLWNKYSRQGMTDIPLMTFAIISLWSLIKLKESGKASESILYSLLFMVCFAAGLMTKVIISFLPLLFVVMFFRKFDEKNKKRLVLISSSAGILLAAPWHIYMSVKHGYEFCRVFFAPHIYSSVENNSPVLGVFYYFNQLIITNPFLIISLVFLIAFVIFRKKIINLFEEPYSFLVKIFLAWFGIGFVLLSLSATKLPHYTLYIILPAIVLAAYLYEKAEQDKIAAKWKYWLIALIIVTFLWAISFQLRQELKDLLMLHSFSLRGLFFILLIAALTGYGFYSKEETKTRILNPSFTMISYIILIILVVKIIFVSVLFFEGNIRGGMDAAYYLERSDRSSFVYLYHEHNSSDSLNPQLAWYTKGWTCNWRKGKTFHPVGLPKKGINFITINKTDNYNRDYLVYYVPEDRDLADVVTEQLKQTRHIINRTRNYIIFSPVMFQRNLGYPI